MGGRSPLSSDNFLTTSSVVRSGHDSAPPPRADECFESSDGGSLQGTTRILPWADVRSNSTGGAQQIDQRGGAYNGGSTTQVDYQLPGRGQV